MNFSKNMIKRIERVLNYQEVIAEAKLEGTGSTVYPVDYGFIIRVARYLEAKCLMKRRLK